MMSGLKSLWRRGLGGGAGDVYHPPDKDEHMVACDTLLSELDFHMKELERSRRDQQQEEKRLRTGVDYSWLMESSPKSYEMPQMERLELEELCYKICGSECTCIISLFRDALSRDPRVEDLPYIMRSCVRKVLDERPTPETLSEWLTRRTSSLASFSALRLRPPGKVMPVGTLEAEDIEMQQGGQGGQAPDPAQKPRAMSVPSFVVHNEGAAYPV